MTAAGTTVQQTATPTAPPGWARAVATLLGVGYLKPAPGTWASVAALAMWSAAGAFLSAGSLWVATAGMAIAATVAGVLAATRITAATGDSDPGYIVIDEAAGQWIALLWAAVDWKSAVASLILFRVFDIAKPFPLRRLEKLPGGYGVMFDDVGAGLYALAAMQLLRAGGVLA